MSFTRNQKRLLNKLGAELDRQLENDIRFFGRHPQRRHYLRRAYPAECKTVEIVADKLSIPGFALFVAVKKIEGAGRIRASLTMPVYTETDVSEEHVIAIWERLKARDENTIKLEALMHQAAAAGVTKGRS